MAGTAFLDQRLAGRVAGKEPGGIEWSFYGDRFDTRLFELWCLRQLAQEISRQLAVDEPPLDPAWRSGGAAYTWDRPAGVLKLYFQQAISTVSARHQARWHRVDAGHRSLGGVPDIVAQTHRRVDDQERLAVVDPKLRQRGGPPTEELYKILGYLDNFGLSREPFGAVLYHTTAQADMPSYSYKIESHPGEVHAVALNPASSGPAHHTCSCGSDATWFARYFPSD